MKHTIIASSVFLLIPSLCFATVGGAERIEVLGYDQKDQKIFLTRHYEDASGRLPTLYYYQLSTKAPEKLIEVKSLYQQIKTFPYPRSEQKFFQELEKIQSRLKPLTAIDTKRTTVNIVQKKINVGDFWHTSHPDDAFKVKRYTQNYVIKNVNFKSTVLSSISYIKPQIKLKALYQLPKGNAHHPVQLAIVQYNGIPVETGYLKEDAALLLKEKKR